jgi:hypothetical protein
MLCTGALLRCRCDSHALRNRDIRCVLDNRWLVDLGMLSGCILGKALRIARGQPLLFFSLVLVGLVSCQGEVDQFDALSQV